MSNIVIRVENLSKQYRLGSVDSGTLQDDFKRWWALARGKEDPFLKIGESNDRTSKGESDYVWSLKDINFEVQQGEVLGIIGRNGAGKSTLLKILSKVTAPTTGSVKVKGRIASLLEVGTGFHPELTGRENIFLNGAILGMSKLEIRNKFDEIVAFSGVEKYIDTPVKRYSSGMYVRLAFAVAAHLESEILIIDEVLAVGDMEFQKKCLGKMKNLSHEQGKTVLFVSHNMATVMELCDRGLLIKNGKVESTGSISEIMPQYLNSFKAEELTTELHKIKTRNGNGDIIFHKIEILDASNNTIDFALSGQEIKFKLTLSVKNKKAYERIHASIKFVDSNDRSLFHLSNSVSNGREFQIKNGTNTFTIICEIPKLPLNKGIYNFHLFCSDLNSVFDEINFAGELKVQEGNFFENGKIPSSDSGNFLVYNNWHMLNE